MEVLALIEVKSITKKYGSFVAVDNINFEVNDNEIVGFLGPNGAGKSTTMNMITGYIEPSKGKIIVNGYDISKSPLKAKRQIGYMPESVPLYNDLTVNEFVSYMANLKGVKRKNVKQEVDKVLSDTGLTNVKHKLIKNISRGYKQRVSLAGALVGNPQILILDEPTVGLDPKQITEIRDLIKKLGKNHTVILSSHILSEVSQICEKVIIINHGKIVAVDTPQNLENKTQNDNTIMVTVEDKNDKMKTVSKKLKNATSIKFIKQFSDGSSQYLISAKADTDIRKEVFNVFAKEDITVLELKKSENTLEDAFLKIIDDKDSNLESSENAKKKAKAERKKELDKMDKDERKLAIKEDKKKAKEEKKLEIDKKWEEEQEIERFEKEKKQQLKETKKEIKNSKKSKKTDEDKSSTGKSSKNTSSKKSEKGGKK